MPEKLLLKTLPMPATKGNKPVNFYFSTNTQMNALEILDCYQSRFQIEFLYRDAKQYTGLNDSQVLSENKLNFHFNAALTTINTDFHDYN